LVTYYEGECAADRYRLMSRRDHHDHGEGRTSEMLREAIRRLDRITDVAGRTDRVMLHTAG
jgi:hypothetical protein